MEADVVVIGAGQAGLSAAYHLARRGAVPAIGVVPELKVVPAASVVPPAPKPWTYAVLDAEEPLEKPPHGNGQWNQ